MKLRLLGKRYYIDRINDYQQALDKLAILYKEGPMKGAGEEDLASGEDIGSADTGGGEFPGEEGGAGGGGEAPEAGGEEGGGEDLSGEPIDFEAGEEPEA